MSLTYFYGKLIDSVTAQISFSRSVWVYGGILFGTFIFFRAWSVTNIFMRNKARGIIYRKTFAASLRADNDGNAIFSQDIENASWLFLDFVYTLPANIISFLVVFALLVIHSQFIMLFYLASFALFFIISYSREKNVVPLYYQAQNQFYALMAKTENFLSGSVDLTLNGRHGWAREKLSGDVSGYNRRFQTYKKKSIYIEIISQSNNYAAYVIALAVSFSLFLNGYYTFGMCVVVIEYAKSMGDSLSWVYADMNELMDYTAHLQRVNARIKEKEININNHAASAGAGDVFLKADNLSFKYERTLFENVSFVLRKGAPLALRGASGAGKSTLLSIIADKIPLQSGSITVYGQRKIGMLDQAPYLFNRTIRENLALANQNAADSEMEKALAQVGLDLSLDVIAGESGKAISGGQRTRLALARLVMQNPDIVLLDEPTTGVDQKTREFLIEFLSAFLADKASIITSHESDVLSIASSEMLI
ncbi:MAG: ABC transporter ATP-binding protein/permease [Treponema sp.]|nr:ABC transporter ATP-binding protein/permease [Treponema sp.]